MAQFEQVICWHLLKQLKCFHACKLYSRLFRLLYHRSGDIRWHLENTLCPNDNYYHLTNLNCQLGDFEWNSLPCTWTKNWNALNLLSYIIHTAKVYIYTFFKYIYIVSLLENSHHAKNDCNSKKKQESLQIVYTNVR